MITLEELREALSYNADTGVFTWVKTKSLKRLNGTKAGSLQLTGYIGISISGRKYFAHRLAWFYVHGSMPEICIDHLNGIRSDNRLCNLRPATRTENNHNTLRLPPNKTGYSGISWAKRQKKWKAKIRVNGKSKQVGYFNSQEEAHAAYLEAKRKFHPFFSN